MPEAKSILSSVLSVLVGLVMLGLVTYIIYINTDIWHVFAKQSDASRSIRSYSEYAAYDGTEVRGQDVMSLVSKTQGDPFVIVSVGGTPKFASCDFYTQSLNFNDLDTTDIRGLDCWGSLQGAQVNACCADTCVWSDSTILSTDDLQNRFLRGDLGSGGNQYASFRSYLVYDGEPSTNIVGIVVVKQ